VQRQAIANTWEHSVESVFRPGDFQQDGAVSRIEQLTLEFPGKARLNDMIARALNQ